MVVGGVGRGRIAPAGQTCSTSHTIQPGVQIEARDLIALFTATTYQNFKPLSALVVELQ
jgi:hypothetical protein